MHLRKVTVSSTKRHGLTAARHSPKQEPKELILYENYFLFFFKWLLSSVWRVSFLWRVCARLRADSAVVGWVLSSSLTYFRTSLQLSAVYRRSSAYDVDPVTKTRRLNAESRALPYRFLSWESSVSVLWTYFVPCPTSEWLFRGLFMSSLVDSVWEARTRAKVKCGSVTLVLNAR